MNAIKIFAILTVLVANIVLAICVLLILDESTCDQTIQPNCHIDTRYLVGLVCTCVICALILVTATLDNISWWAASFPDVSMCHPTCGRMLHRLRTLDPGLKVTVQQDLMTTPTQYQPFHQQLRKRAHEMYRPREWVDNTDYSRIEKMKGVFEVLKLCLEVAPLNMEARDDINLSIQQLLNQNSSGLWTDNGSRVPGLVLESKTKQISLPLSPNLYKIRGDPVRILLYKNVWWTRMLCPTLHTLKQVLFLLVLMVPALGTVLSITLSDRTTHLTVKKRYSARQAAELNEDDCDLTFALLDTQQKQTLKKLSEKLFGGSARQRLAKPYLKIVKESAQLGSIAETESLFQSDEKSIIGDEKYADNSVKSACSIDIECSHGPPTYESSSEEVSTQSDRPPRYSALSSPISPSLQHICNNPSLPTVLSPSLSHLEISPSLPLNSPAVDSTVSLHVDSTVSLPVDSTVSLPVDSTVSLPVDSTVSLPVDSTVSLPMDSTASLPLDSTAPLPVESTSSLPVDSAASLPLASSTSLLLSPSLPDYSDALQLGDVNSIYSGRETKVL